MMTEQFVSMVAVRSGGSDDGPVAWQWGGVSPTLAGAKGKIGPAAKRLKDAGTVALAGRVLRLKMDQPTGAVAEGDVVYQSELVTDWPPEARDIRTALEPRKQIDAAVAQAALQKELAEARAQANFHNQRADTLDKALKGLKETAAAQQKLIDELNAQVANVHAMRAKWVEAILWPRHLFGLIEPLDPAVEAQIAQAWTTLTDIDRTLAERAAGRRVFHELVAAAQAERGIEGVMKFEVDRPRSETPAPAPEAKPETGEPEPAAEEPEESRVKRFGRSALKVAAFVAAAALGAATRGMLRKLVRKPAKP
jgi:hypothetical protein